MQRTGKIFQRGGKNRLHVSVCDDSRAGNFPVKKKEKQVKAWDKNHEFYNYCQSIRGKNNLLYSKEAIKSDDENAIEALEEKIDSLMEVQETWQINKYYRKHHTLEGCDLLTENSSRSPKDPWISSYDRSPYPSWALQTIWQISRDASGELMN